MSVNLDKLRVLHVEPSEAQHKIIAKQFLQLGVRDIKYVGTGAQVFNILPDCDFDLIVSAMHLADTTGSELIIKIRDGVVQSNVPFMLISSETQNRYLEPVRQAGVIAMLPKPFDTTELEKSVYAVLEYIDPDELHLSNVHLEDFAVLVVDDSETSRRHIIRLLKKMGVENIIESEDGLDALSHVQVDPVDLVVTDFHMPVMDGGQLIQSIRAGAYQSGVPILMISSEHDPTKLETLRNLGASEICDKPFAATVLKRLIEQIVT